MIQLIQYQHLDTFGYICLKAMVSAPPCLQLRDSLGLDRGNSGSGQKWVSRGSCLQVDIGLSLGGSPLNLDICSNQSKYIDQIRFYSPAIHFTSQHYTPSGCFPSSPAPFRIPGRPQSSCPSSLGAPPTCRAIPTWDSHGILMGFSSSISAVHS